MASGPSPARRGRMNLRRAIAASVLTFIYWLAMAISRFCRWLTRQAKSSTNHTSPHKRIIVCVTIDNPNWFRAHIVPLVKSGYGEVVVVCDEPLDAMANLSYVCPPDWAKKTLSRAGAKFIWTVLTSFKQPADLIMGYHLFPCAIICLIAARLSGTQAAYQVTSGKAELAGGGYKAENPLFKMLGGHSQFLENRATDVSREFDMVLVRGSSIRQFFLEFGYQGKLETVTGSIKTGHEGNERRDIDVIFVGRLVEIKQVPVLLDAIERVNKRRTITAHIVGDGPLQATLEQQTKDRGLENSVKFLGQRDDVYGLLCRSKIFVLTSRSESVSIAMLEAMSRGTVPITTRVGDLADFVTDDRTGYLVDVGDSEKIAEHICHLLENTTKLEEMGRESQRIVNARCSVESISNYWLQTMTDLTRSEISNN